MPDGREVQLTLHDLGEKWAALQKELQEAQRRDRKTRLDLKRAREDAEALAKELAKERKLKQAREVSAKETASIGAPLDFERVLLTGGCQGPDAAVEDSGAAEQERIGHSELNSAWLGMSRIRLAPIFIWHCCCMDQVLAGVPDKDLVWGEQLGKGSYGVVRRAAYGGMSFAVKELNPGAAAIKEVEAFKSLCARMEEPHPNIVHVLYIKQATTVSPKRWVGRAQHLCVVVSWAD